MIRWLNQQVTDAQLQVGLCSVVCGLGCGRWKEGVWGCVCRFLTSSMLLHCELTLHRIARPHRISRTNVHTPGDPGPGLPLPVPPHRPGRIRSRPRRPPPERLPPRQQQPQPRRRRLCSQQAGRHRQQHDEADDGGGSGGGRLGGGGGVTRVLTADGVAAAVVQGGGRLRERGDKGCGGAVTRAAGG